MKIYQNFVHLNTPGRTSLHKLIQDSRKEKRAKENGQELEGTSPFIGPEITAVNLQLSENFSKSRTSFKNQ
jgi:hypothetical protein